MTRERLKKLESELKKLENVLFPESKFPEFTVCWIGEDAEHPYNIRGPVGGPDGGSSGSGKILLKKLIAELRKGFLI